MANADVVATGSLQLSTTIDTTSLTSQANRAAAQVQSSMEGAIQKIQNGFNGGLNSAIKGTTQAIKVFGEAGVAAIGVTLGRAVQLGLEFNGAEQQIRKSFTSLLGGSQQATDLLGKLKTVAGNAFPVGTINEAALGLVKVGVSAKNIIPLLNTVTQAVKNVGGTAQDVTQISNALERVETTGKFTSRTLLALSSTGVNAAQLIGTAMGKTADQIRVEISKGAISGQQALEQLAIGVQKSTASAIANTVETAKGARSSFTNALTALGGELTKAFVNPEGGGAEAKIFDDLTVIITKLKSVSGPVVELVQKLADGLVKAADSAKTFIQQLSVDQVKKFVDQIEKFAPFVLAAAGAFTGFTTKLAGGIPVIGDLVTKLNPVAGGLLGLALAIPGVRDLFTKLIETLSVGLKPAFEQLQKALPPLLDAISKIASDVAPAFIGFAASAAPLLVAAAKAVDLLATALGPLLKLLDFGPITILLELFLAKLAIGSLTGSNTFQTIANGIGGVISKLKEGAVAGAAFNSAVAAPAAPVGGAVAGVPNAITGQVEAAAATATAAAAGKQALVDIGGVITGDTLEADKLAEAFGKIPEGIKKATSEAGFFSTETGKLSGIFSNLGNSAKNVFSSIGNSFTALKNKLSGGIGAPTPTAGPSGGTGEAIAGLEAQKNAANELADTINSKVAPAADKAATAFTRIAGQQNRDALGRYAQGFDGITSAEARSIAQAEQLGSSTGKLSGIFSSLGNSAKNVFSSIGESFTNLKSKLSSGLPTPTAPNVPTPSAKLPSSFANGEAISGEATALKSVATEATGAAAEVEKVAASSGKLSGVLGGLGGAAKGAFAGLAEGLGSLLNPVNLVITGIGIIANRLSDLKNKAAASAGQFAAKIDFSNLTDPGQITSQAAAASDALQAAQKKLAKDTAGINGLKIGGFRITPTVDINKEQANIDALKKALTSLQGLGHDTSSVFNQVASLTGTSFANIGAKAKELGIDFSTIKPGDIQPDVDKLVAALGGLATNINGTVVPSLQNLQAQIGELGKQVDAVASASDAVTNAQQALTSANQSAAAATAQLADIEKQRKKVLEDTTANARELKAAQDELIKLSIQQDQLDADRIKTLKTLKDLQDPAQQADKQSQADEKVQRAKIALNNALQAQKDLQDQANKATDAGNKSADTSVNLAGLSLDQVKAKLANVRATLAAQQQGNAAAAQPAATAGKTPQQIADETLTKQLDVKDAQRAVTEAVKAQGEVQGDINAQILVQQDHLKELGVQQDQLDGSKIEAQLKLNDLKKGEFTQTQKLLDLDKQRKAALQSLESAQRAVTKAKEDEAVATLKLKLEEDTIAMDAGAVLQDTININNQKLNALKNIDPTILANLKAQAAQIQDNLNLLNQQKATAAAAAAVPASPAAGVSQAAFQSLTDAINLLAKNVGPEAALTQQAYLATKGVNIPIAINAEGSLVTRPIISHIGEGFKPELILPLSKPDRVWQLISEHLPRYPGALQAVQDALVPRTPLAVQKAVQSVQPALAAASLARGPSFISRGDGPMTYDQADAIIKLLEEQPTPQVSVEAPISITGNFDENLFARKVEQRILRAIEDRLR